MNIKKLSGFSIIELIIAIAIFSIVSSSLVGLILGGFNILQRSNDMLTAYNLANQSVEAVLSIKDEAWNTLVYSKSAIVVSGNDLIFSGEDTAEQIGNFSRNVDFYPVYRDLDGNIVSATTTDAYLDVNSKELLVTVGWELPNGDTKEIKRNLFLTNWSSKNWVQTDWSGGDGQTQWSDENRYFSKGEINDSAGQLELSEVATSTFATNESLISSEFNIASTSNFNAISWDEVILESCADCSIKFQIKTAVDENGSPGSWSDTWSGPDGDEDSDEDDYYATSTGSLIHASHIGDEWIKYKATLFGTTTTSPVLEEVRINYKK